MNVIVSENYYNLKLDVIENYYNVKYIGDFCIKDKYNNWSEFPVSCFYSAHPDKSKGHSEYLGIFVRNFTDENSIVNSTVILCNAETAFKNVIFTGIEYENNIYISCYRHHYVSPSEGVMIDGGRDYTRYSTDQKLVSLEFKNNHWNIIPLNKNRKLDEIITDI